MLGSWTSLDLSQLHFYLPCPKSNKSVTIILKLIKFILKHNHVLTFGLHKLLQTAFKNFFFDSDISIVIYMSCISLFTLRFWIKSWSKCWELKSFYWAKLVFECSHSVTEIYSKFLLMNFAVRVFIISLY